MRVARLTTAYHNTIGNTMVQSSIKTETHTQVHVQVQSTHNHYVKNSDGLFVCPHEGCTYAPQRLMQTMFYHLKKHEDALPFKCSTCKKEFLHKKTLENHMISQHADKTIAKGDMFNCPIPGCNFSSLTKGNCRIHILRIHMKAKVHEILDKTENGWNCTRCNHSFTNSTGFYYHAADCLPERLLSAPPIRKALGLPPLVSASKSSTLSSESSSLLNQVDNRQEVVA